MLDQHDLENMWGSFARHPWIGTLLLVSLIVLLWVANMYKDAVEDIEQRGE